jgi:hypothetical protein
MRTKTIIIIEGPIDGPATVYSNDPDIELSEVGIGDMEECGCCGAHHRVGFHGDCREDNERFHPIN